VQKNQLIKVQKMILQPNGQLTDKSDNDTSLPLFRLAFRPFFWLGAVFGAICIALWGLLFSGYIDFSPYGGGYFWHVHEMLFGFTVAIITGFLLTAVQTWTGFPSVKGIALSMLVSLWVVGRLLMLFPYKDSDIVVAFVDVLFLPMVALALAIPIIKAKMWRNLFFVPILLIMAALNGLFHLAVIGKVSLSFISVSHVMVLLITLVMCIMGGRVFPMFTANGTGTPRVAPIKWVEQFSIILVVLSVVVSSGLLGLPKLVDGLIYLSAGIVNTIRVFRWKIWVTFRTPLVWSLHLSYWSICIGLVMLSFVKFELSSNISTAYHALTVGGISFMILAMISRVSLGHTGRKIQVGKLMTVSFVLMCLSFCVRVFIPNFLQNYPIVVVSSAMLWVLAIGIFVFKYTSILLSARIDGKHG
jgi:uncharacterized protein involved in response to NO